MRHVSEPGGGGDGSEEGDITQGDPRGDGEVRDWRWEDPGRSDDSVSCGDTGHGGRPGGGSSVSGTLEVGPLGRRTPDAEQSDYPSFDWSRRGVWTRSTTVHRRSRSVNGSGLGVSAGPEDGLQVDRDDRGEVVWTVGQSPV